MKKFIKNHWDTIMNWSIGAGGIIATIVAANKTEGNGFGYLYVSLLVMQTVLLCFGLYTVKIKNSYAAEYEKLNMELTQHKKINQEQTEERVLVVQSGKKNVATIISNLKNMSKLNNDLCNRIPAISSQSYHVLETLKESGVQDANLLRKEIIESYKDFSNGLFDLFKRYSSHLLTNTVKMVEAYLRLQGYNHKVSATIKLFDDCYYENSGRREDVVVYTAFRDKETYDGKKEREIGQIPYTIDGNVDFTMCLTKDHYVINNAKKDSESYFNEHLNYYSYCFSYCIAFLRCWKISISVLTALVTGAWMNWGNNKAVAMICAILILIFQSLNAASELFPFENRKRELREMLLLLEPVYEDMEAYWLRIVDGEVAKEDIADKLKKCDGLRHDILKHYFKDDALPNNKRIEEKAKNETLKYINTNLM